MTDRAFLHVLNGDATRVKLERSAVRGTFAVWADVLHEGPCLLLPRDELRALRAKFLSDAGYGPAAALVDIGRRWDDRLDAYAEYDEVVFWFEHDLFDQLLLIRHLHWLTTIARGSTPAFSLICIDAFPGVSDFVGLGQLAPEQLASLLDTRHAITGGEIDLGARAWTRFCGPEPLALVALLLEDTSALPFLEGALRRFLSDYPAVGTGLSRSERQILDTVARGPSRPVDVFLATGRMEERIFMGDTTFWRIARALADARVPLLAFDGNGEGDLDRSGLVLPDGALTLTAAGSDVLAGGADHVALNGIDRWMGGVHLTDGRWRWDGQTIVESR